jgi:hypothetical protein
VIIVVERECYSFRFSFPCYCFVIVTGDDIYYLGKLVVGNHEWVNCRDRENFLRLVKKICFIDREGILSEKLGNSRGRKNIIEVPYTKLYRILR